MVSVLCRKKIKVNILQTQILADLCFVFGFNFALFRFRITGIVFKALDRIILAWK